MGNGHQLQQHNCAVVVLLFVCVFALSCVTVAEASPVHSHVTGKHRTTTHKQILQHNPTANTNSKKTHSATHKHKLEHDLETNDNNNNNNNNDVNNNNNNNNSSTNAKVDDPVQMSEMAKQFVVGGGVDRQAMMAANDAIAWGEMRRVNVANSSSFEDDIEEQAPAKNSLHIVQDIDKGTTNGRYQLHSGSPLKLEFQVENARNFFWTKNKLAVRHEGKDGVLLIVKSTQADSGFYRCLASNGDNSVFSKEVFVDVDVGQDKNTFGTVLRTNAIGRTDPLQLTKCMEQMWEDRSFFDSSSGTIYGVPPPCSYATSFCSEAQIKLCDKAGFGPASREQHRECDDSEIKCRWMIRDCFLQVEQNTDTGSFERCVYSRSMHLFGIPLSDDNHLAGLEYSFPNTPKTCVTDFKPDEFNYLVRVPFRVQKFRLHVDPVEGSTFQLFFSLEAIDASELESLENTHKNSGNILEDSELGYIAQAKGSVWLDLAEYREKFHLEDGKRIVANVRIVVTSEDKKNIREYTVVFCHQLASTKFDLYELRTAPPIANLTFRSDVDQYDELFVPHEVSSIAFFANENHPDAAALMLLSVNGGRVGNTQNRAQMLPGSNIVQIRMEAEDGAESDIVYTFQIRRDYSHNSDLLGRNNDLLSGITLHCQGAITMKPFPAFDMEWMFYEASAPAVCGSVFVTPTTADPEAFIEVNFLASTSGERSPPIGILPGHNLLQIVVTSMNRASTRTYHVLVTREREQNVLDHEMKCAGQSLGVDEVAVVLPRGVQSSFTKTQMESKSDTQALIKVPSYVTHVYLKPISKNILIPISFEVNSDAVPNTALGQHLTKPVPRMHLEYGPNIFTIRSFPNCKLDTTEDLPETKLRIDRTYPVEEMDLTFQKQYDKSPISLSNLEVSGQLRWATGKFKKIVQGVHVPSVHYGDDADTETIEHFQVKVPGGATYIMIKAAPTTPTCYVSVQGSGVDPTTHMSTWIPFTSNMVVKIEVRSFTGLRTKKYVLDFLEASSNAALESLRLYPKFDATLTDTKVVEMGKNCQCGMKCQNGCFQDIPVSNPEAWSRVLVVHAPQDTKGFILEARAPAHLDTSIAFTGQPGHEHTSNINGIALKEFFVMEGVPFEISVTSEDQSSTHTIRGIVYPSTHQTKTAQVAPMPLLTTIEAVEFRLDRDYVYVQFNGFFDHSMFKFAKEEYSAPQLIWTDNKSKPQKLSLGAREAVAPEYFFQTYLTHVNELRVMMQPISIVPNLKSIDLALDQVKQFPRCFDFQGLGISDENLFAIGIREDVLRACRWEAALRLDRRFVKIPLQFYNHEVKQTLLESDNTALLIPQQALEGFGVTKNMRVRRTPPARLASASLRFYSTFSKPDKSSHWGQFVLFLEFSGPIACPGFLFHDVPIFENLDLTFKNFEIRDSLFDLMYTGLDERLVFLALNKIASAKYSWTSPWCIDSVDSENVLPWILDGKKHKDIQSGATETSRFEPNRIVSNSDPSVIILKSDQLALTAAQLEALEGNVYELDFNNLKSSNIKTVVDASGQPIQIVGGKHQTTQSMAIPLTALPGFDASTLPEQNELFQLFSTVTKMSSYSGKYQAAVRNILISQMWPLLPSGMLDPSEEAQLTGTTEQSKRAQTQLTLSFGFPGDWLTKTYAEETILEPFRKIEKSINAAGRMYLQSCCSDPSSATAQAVVKDFHSGGKITHYFELFEACTEPNNQPLFFTSNELSIPCALRGPVADASRSLNRVMGVSGDRNIFRGAQCDAGSRITPTSSNNVLLDSVCLAAVVDKAVSVSESSEDAFDSSSADLTLADRKPANFLYPFATVLMGNEARKQFLTSPERSRLIYGQVGVNKATEFESVASIDQCVVTSGVWGQLVAQPFAMIDMSSCGNKIHGSPCQLADSEEGFCYGCCLPRASPKPIGYAAVSFPLFGSHQGVRVWCDTSLDAWLHWLAITYPENKASLESPTLRSDHKRFFSGFRITFCQAAYVIKPGNDCKDVTECSVIVEFGGPDTFAGVMEPSTFMVRWDHQRYGPVA